MKSRGGELAHVRVRDFDALSSLKSLSDNTPFNHWITETSSALTLQTKCSFVVPKVHQVTRRALEHAFIRESDLEGRPFRTEASLLFSSVASLADRALQTNIGNNGRMMSPCFTHVGGRWTGWTDRWKQIQVGKTKVRPRPSISQTHLGTDDFQTCGWCTGQHCNTHSGASPLPALGSGQLLATAGSMSLRQVGQQRAGSRMRVSSFHARSVATQGWPVPPALYKERNLLKAKRRGSCTSVRRNRGTSCIVGMRC